MREDKQTLIIKDFDSLRDLREQVLDFSDHIRYYAKYEEGFLKMMLDEDKQDSVFEYNVDFDIQMTQNQLEKYQSLLFDYGKNVPPETYQGHQIKVV